MPKYHADMARTGLSWMHLPLQNINSDVQFCPFLVSEVFTDNLPVPEAIGFYFKLMTVTDFQCAQ